jgi:hypothetical protein
MKASLWAIVGIAAASAGGSGYMLVPDRNGASGPATARDVAAVQPSANDHRAFAAADLARSPITAPMQANPFGSWIAVPKPPPAVEAAAPARPVTPAFPYAYAGTLRKGREAAEAFLLKGKDLVPIKAGAVLDGVWRIEALTSDRIEVTYLPASERLSMRLATLTGGSNAMAAVATPSSVIDAYEDPATGPAGVGAAPVPVRPDSIAAFNNGPNGGRAVQPMAAAPGFSAPAAASGSTLGSPAPTTTARLGSDTPAQGSMPLGTEPSGTFPKGDTPTGKLGH